MANTLYQVLGDVLGIGINAVKDDLSMDYEDRWDSLKHMEVVVGLEEAFGLTLEADEIVAITSLAAIKDLLIAKGIDLRNAA